MQQSIRSFFNIFSPVRSLKLRTMQSTSVLLQIDQLNVQFVFTKRYTTSRMYLLLQNSKFFISFNYSCYTIRILKNFNPWLWFLLENHRCQLNAYFKMNDFWPWNIFQVYSISYFAYLWTIFSLWHYLIRSTPWRRRYTIE
jgi:hypothetical protein